MRRSHLPASAVRTYREALASAQRVAREVITVDAVGARAKSKHHAAAVADYNAAIQRGVVATPPPQVDPGQSAMLAAMDRVVSRHALESALRVRLVWEVIGWRGLLITGKA